jgi:hypothetical protein
MGRYSEFRYLKDGILYGDRSKLALSAEPLIATALKYNKIAISFSTPTGTYIGFRIVRNQDAYPETEQDGVVIFESTSGANGIISTLIIDSDETQGAPLVEGRFAYYKAWILTADNEYWSPAGQTYTLVPSKHNLKLSNDISAAYSVAGLETIDRTLPVNTDFSTTHQRFMDILPRVITSATNGSVDEINDPEASDYGENTIISRFLSGFSFTLDEYLTFIKLVLPEISGKYTAPEIMRLQAHEFGITSDNELLTKAQKRLIREAVYCYSRKGTLKGLNTFTESITGYDNSQTITKNLLLSYEDSTFLLENWELDNVVGNWTVGSGDTISVYADIAVQTGVGKSLDSTYTAKITTSASNKPAYLGILNPIITAIPVTENLTYSLSYYIRKVGTTAGVTPTVFWYDSNGKYLSPSEGVSANATSTEWNRRSLANVTAPENAKYAVIQLVFAITGTYYLDMVQFEQSSTVTDYEEPRGVSVFLKPDKINYIKNPSFETNTTGWTITGSGASISREDSTLSLAPSSSYMAEITCSNSGTTTLKAATDKEIESGKLYTFSFYAKTKTVTSGQQAIVTAIPKDGSTSVSTTVTKTATITSSWTRITVPVFIDPYNSSDSNLVSINLEIAFSSGSPVIQIDAVQFERGIVSDYFDGSRYESGASWTGTANSSISVIYFGRKTKISRYMKDIKTILPANTPYYVTFYGSASFTGVALSGIS